MAVVRFKTEYVPRPALPLAKREAVFKPLFPKSKVTKDRLVEATVFKVLRPWRRCCNVLREVVERPWDAVHPVHSPFITAPTAR